MQMNDIIYNRDEIKYIKEDIMLSFHSISVAIMFKNDNYDQNTVLAGFSTWHNRRFWLWFIEKVKWHYLEMKRLFIKK